MDARERRYARIWMLVVVLVVAVLFCGVAAKLVKLHLIDPSAPGYRPPTNYVSTYRLLGLRGRILDRNGVALAESLSGRVVYVDQNDPKLKALSEERRAELPLELAKLLGVSQEKMLDAFNGYHTYRGRRVTSRKVCEISDDAVIRELARRSSLSTPKSERIAGVDFSQPLAVRSHPNGARLGHTLGYINNDGVGVYGVEQRFDSHLSGKDGTIVTMVDARRREIRDRRLEENPPVHGDDVTLTIDNNIQYIIESALSKALERFQADSGIILVQRVRTGEILGMATLPGFDPQEYGSFPQEQWKNIAVSRNYEPGSVMKAVTVAMALEYGIITERTPFDVGQKGYWVYAGKPLRDHAYGIVHAKEILARSSNIGTAMIGLRMAEPCPRLGATKPNELLWRAFRAMGFGQTTGIELVGEEAGILRHFSQWDKLSPTRMPIGQGISVTAVQLCNAYATIANGGVRMRPTILKEIRAHDGTLVRDNPPEVLGRPLSPEVCRKMLLMLQAVTDRSQGGTAGKAALRSYTVAGKTGTGQIPVNGSYNHSDYNASFVGIYPASAPELVILVTIERPKGPYRMGGSVAAPTFADVAEEIGHYLGIPADKFPKEGA